MENNQFFYLFPIPLFISHYPNSYDSELDSIKKLEFHKEQLDSDINIAQSVDTYILNKPEFKNIKTFIEDKLNYFSKEVFKYSSELMITQSWINLSSFGKSHNRHSHPNSIISGVWYIDIADNSPPIRFHNSNVREINLDTTETNEFNGITYSLVPKKSDIIFFPSNLHHDVAKNEVNSPRISLSFNSWPKEHFGNAKYLTSTLSI